MKRMRVLVLLLALAAIGPLATACGTSDVPSTTPTAIGNTGSAGDSTDPSGAVATKGPAAIAGATVGSPIDLGTYAVTLSSAKIEDGLLKANFTFDNSKGTKGLVVNATSLSALGPDGAILEGNILCSTLATRVAAGAKIQGPVCWNVSASTTTGLKVRYDPLKGAGAAVTWNLP